MCRVDDDRDVNGGGTACARAGEAADSPPARGIRGHSRSRPPPPLVRPRIPTILILLYRPLRGVSHYYLYYDNSIIIVAAWTETTDGTDI